MTKIPTEKIDDVRQASDIVDIVSGYLSLKKKGRNFFGLCPFHKEKTPSFSVNPDLQIFHCFGCGAGGNVFTFIMKTEGVTFIEAVKILAQTAGIVLPEETEDFEQYREKEALYYVNKMAADFFQKTIKSEQAKSAREYLENRGLKESDFETFGIGYAPNQWDGLLNKAKELSIKTELLYKAGLVLKKENSNYYDRFRGRITFAIKNLTGQVVGFGARRIINDNSPKYINSPETEIYQKRFILYGLFLSRDFIRRFEEVVIVEGYTDFTSLWKSNINNVVATSGTSLTEDHARLLRRYTSNAVLLYDSDSAGAAAAIRGADILLENGMEVKICTLPSGKDPDEIARSEGEIILKRLLASAVPLMEYKLQHVENQNRLGSSSQKAAATREILATISKVTDPIRQSFLVRDLADKLKIEESTLWEEVNKLARQRKMGLSFSSEQKEERIDDKYFSSSKGISELALLEVGIRNPEIISKIMLNINTDDITHGEIKEIFDSFKIDTIDPLTFKAFHYLSKIQNPTIASKLSDIMSQENPHPKPWAYARDCIIAFHLSIMDERIRQIKEEMRPENISQKNPKDVLDELKYTMNEREKIRLGEYIVE